jgi:hypothetical protein
VTAHQIIHVITVRNGLVATARPMNMVRVVPSTLVCRRARYRIGLRDRDSVLVDMPFVGVMKMPIMEVVDMSVMLDGLVAATWAVYMVV